jgi:hypothetical protein
MMKMFAAFLAVFFAFYLGIPAFRRLTNKDKLSYTKLYLFSAMCAVLAVSFLVLIVILF